VHLALLVCIENIEDRILLSPWPIFDHLSANIFDEYDAAIVLVNNAIASCDSLA